MLEPTKDGKIAHFPGQPPSSFIMHRPSQSYLPIFQSTFSSLTPNNCCPHVFLCLLLAYFPLSFLQNKDKKRGGTGTTTKNKMPSSAVSNQPTAFSTPLQSKKYALLAASAPRRIVHVMASKGAGDGNRITPLDTPNHHSNHHHQKQPFRSWMSNSPPLGVWDQFPTERTLRQMTETMERMMQDPFSYSSISFPSLSGTGEDEHGVNSYRRWRTPWEIKEGDEEYKMRFDMPGMTKEDVKVWVEEEILVVNAEKLPNKNKADGNCTVADAVEGKEQEEAWSAKSYGRYNSRIVLPYNVDVKKITAEVKDGVLYITIPKAAASAKMVDIDVK